MHSVRRSSRIATTTTTMVESRAMLQTMVTEAMEGDLSEEAPPPKPKGRKRKRAPAKEDDEDDFAPPPKDDEAEPDTSAPKNSPKTINKAPAARKSKAPVVYDIPKVETRKTTFTGRLGYACLNTVLRDQKPASTSVFCSRTCRIATMKEKGMRFVKELGKQNLKDMLALIKWNEENNIRFMRMSSNIFPFASHGEYGYSLFDKEDEPDEDIAMNSDADVDSDAPKEPNHTIPELLAQVGALAKSYGHRITSHPGQFVQLGSASAKVRASSIRELVYHTEMFEGMGIDQDGVMIVHGGGVYGNKPETLERIKKTITEELPANVRARLVLENDEMCYAAEDLLPLCEELDVPLVFDYHHHNLNPSSKGPIAEDEFDKLELGEAERDAGAVPGPEDEVVREGVVETQDGTTMVQDQAKENSINHVNEEILTNQVNGTRGQEAKPEAEAEAKIVRKAAKAAQGAFKPQETLAQQGDVESELSEDDTASDSSFSPQSHHSPSPNPTLPQSQSHSNSHSNSQSHTQSQPRTAAPPTIPQILARTNAIFKRRGIRPKQHLSEPRKGAVTLMERRAHSDRCARMPEVFDQDWVGGEVEGDVDLMIEAKDKEQAVLHLYRIYGIESVKHESLRPAREETTQTRGRKSSKKAKAKAGAAAADDEDEDEDGAGEVDGEEATKRSPKKKQPVKKKAKKGDDQEDEAPTKTSPKKKQAAKKKNEEQANGAESTTKAPAKRGKKAAATTDLNETAEAQTNGVESAKKTPMKRGKKAAVTTDMADEDEAQVNGAESAKKAPAKRGKKAAEDTTKAPFKRKVATKRKADPLPEPEGENELQEQEQEQERSKKKRKGKAAA